jgi:hypothetical protein
MYFLIKEDETCAERTPPWGEPSIELYIIGALVLGPREQ